MSDEGLIRVSDAERQHTAELLTEQVGTGRLDIAEFDRRVAQAYAATTRAELDATLADMPLEPVAPQYIRRNIRTAPQVEWFAWLGVGILNVAIWAIISLATGTVLYPWPVWVIGPWGVALAVRTVLDYAVINRAMYVTASIGPSGQRRPDWSKHDHRTRSNRRHRCSAGQGLGRSVRPEAHAGVQSAM